VLTSLTQVVTVLPVPGATGYECDVDGAGWTSCSSSTSLTLPLGSHTVAVRAVIGPLAGPTATTAYSLVDPTVSYVTTPVDRAPASTDAVFEFSAATGLTSECSLDGGAFAGCSSPYTVPGKLHPGTHTFAVRSVDAAGAAGPATSYTWNVAKI
jgi:hypothetical protein